MATQKKKRAAKPDEPHAAGGDAKTSVKSTFEWLEAARASLESKKKKCEEDALLALLEAWRTKRAKEIAGLVDRVSSKVKRPPLGHGTLKHMNARWIDLAQKKDPLDVPRLLAGLSSGWSTSLGGRLRELEVFPDDPRIACGLADFFAVTPFSAGVSQEKALATIKALIVRLGDERVPDRLARYASEPRVRDLSDAVTHAMEKDLPSVRRELDAHEREIIAAIDRHLRANLSEDDMLAAIYEAPDDDGPRAVYADWLLEHGKDKARGEFITLQLARAAKNQGSSAEERVLLVRNEHWVGKLGKLVRVLEWSRGFISDVVANAVNQRTFIASLTMPEWSTVRKLEADGVSLPPTFLSMPTFRHLRELGRVNLGFAATIGHASPPHEFLEKLTISEYAEAPLAKMIEQMIDDWPGLPRLASLTLDFPTLLSLEQAAALMKGRLVREQLRTLMLYARPTGVPQPDAETDVAKWIAVFEESNLTRLLVSAPSTNLDVVRSARGAPWRPFSPA